MAAIEAQQLEQIAKLDDTLSKPKAKLDRTIDGKDAPWVEKYRPKTLDDVAAHKEIIDTSRLQL